MPLRIRYLYRAYRYRYRVDPAELRFLCGCLQRGQVAVDVGCHKGAYAYWMRRRVGSSGCVIAFEPQPRQAEYLRRVFTAMRYDNVTIVPLAVSDSIGHLPLHVPTTSTQGASLEAASAEREARGAKLTPQQVRPQDPALDSLVVEVTTLDSFFAERPRKPAFLKIDVEGHELSVLRGAWQMLQAYRPTLLVECEARHRPDSDVRAVFDLLRSLGYEGSFFWNGARRPLAEFDPDVQQRIDPVSGRLPREYANNFAFEPF